MIGPTFYIKRGDLLPAVSSTITDAASNPIDLTGASVLFIMRGPWDAAPIVSAAASVANQVTFPGMVSYTWTGTQTANPGSYRAEFQVTFPGGAIQSFPTNGYIDIEIGNDLATGATASPLYCAPNDLLLGDLSVPPKVNVNTYIDRACRDIDIALGQRFVVPITTGTGTTPLILKAVSADLASAYLLFAQAQGGEDNRINAYAKHLYDRAWERLLPYRMGDQLNGAVLIPSLATSASPVSITQQDPNSILSAFEVFVTTPPSYASVFEGQPYGEGAIYGYPDGPQ